MQAAKIVIGYKIAVWLQIQWNSRVQDAFT